MKLSSSQQWPPTYIVKKNQFAKSVRFKIMGKHHLTIVLPKRFSEKYIPALLEENKLWILKHWKPRPNLELPRQIYLQACNRFLKIEYIATSGKLRCVAKPQDEWVFYGEINNHEKIIQKIKWILKNEAYLFLHKQLTKLSKQCKLPFNEFTIREQSARWGSCSSEKNISLNQQLIFLPLAITNYVIIHELCHTVELNHSAKFWKLVEKFDPNWQEHRKALRLAHDQLPAWLGL